MKCARKLWRDHKYARIWEAVNRFKLPKWIGRGRQLKGNHEIYRKAQNNTGTEIYIIKSLLLQADLTWE